MSGFHIVLCMVTTIYSRFKHAGIIKLLSSAGLGGKGTIKKSIERRRYKRSNIFMQAAV